MQRSRPPRPDLKKRMMVGFFNSCGALRASPSPAGVRVCPLLVAA
jgi:hypothetical protein